MIYVLYGVEQYLVSKERQTIIKKFIEDAEMNVSFYDATKTMMEEIVNDAQTLPFFADYKCIVVQQCKFLTGSSNDGINLEVLEQYLTNENPTTILILEVDHNKIDSRKKIVKNIKKVAQIKEFNKLDDFQHSQFIMNEIKKRNIVMSEEALKECKYRMRFSVSNVIHELDKLATYSLKIEKEDVIALIHRSLEENVFDLFNALIDGDFKQVFQLWKDFDNQNQEVIPLIALLANQYRFLQQVKVLNYEGYSKAEITSELKAHPYRVEKTLSMCHKIKIKQINEILFDLATLDQQIKSGKIDMKLGFELFLIKKGNL